MKLKIYNRLLRHFFMADESIAAENDIRIRAVSAYQELTVLLVLQHFKCKHNFYRLATAWGGCSWH